MARTARRQLEKGDIYYLQNICGAEQPLNVHYESIKDELNIDGGKHVLAMFLNKELF